MSARKLYRILLIDDQEAIHEDYRKILGSQRDSATALSRAAAALFDDDPATCIDWEGFDLSSAMQGQQGFELVQRSIEEGRPYAVAFVDIRMPPGWDGVETVARIWDLDPEILVVFCSAYSDYSWEEMVRRLGRNDRFLILKKPFDNIEVRQCAMALSERWSVSRTDVLTGLLNRRAFQGHLKLEWARAARENHPLSCVMIDFDYFKRINDTLGHQAGDLVLKHMANLLRANCRAGDYLCRYGGEEMCVLLPNADEEVAAAWAERARRSIEAATLSIGEREVRATASFGVSASAAKGDTTEQLIERADQSLIVAKKLGRNRVIRAGATTESGAAFEQVRQHGTLSHGLTAGQVMTTPVSALPAGVTVAQATDFLRKLRINSAPVVDAAGRLVGIVSEKDLICVLPHRNSWSLPVEQIMQRTFVSFEEDAPLDSICDFLGRVTVRRVFVVREGVPVGVVTQGSLLRWYGSQMAAQGFASADSGARPNDPASVARLTLGARVKDCAAELAKNYSGVASDPLAPIVEGMRRLQDLTDALLATSQGQHPVISLTESDSFPSSIVAAALPHVSH